MIKEPLYSNKSIKHQKIDEIKINNSNTKVISYYKQYNSGQVKNIPIEIYKSDNLFKPDTIYHLITYEMLKSFPSLILIEFINPLIIFYDKITLPRSIQYFFNEFRNKYSVYNTTDFINKEDFTEITRTFDYLSIIKELNEKYKESEFKLLDKNYSQLVKDLFNNPILPVNFLSKDTIDDVEVKVGTLLLNMYDLTKGIIRIDEKRIRIFNNTKYFHLDKLNVFDIETDDEVDINTIVHGLTKPKTRVFVGTVLVCNDTLRIIPLDQRYVYDFHYYSENINYYHNKKVHCCLFGERIQIFDILGESSNFDVEINSVMKNLFIDYVQIENNNVKDTEIDKLPVKEHKVDSDRIDFREKYIFSIDPPGCTDIDDALHIDEYKEYIEVGVHIADVSEYVLPNTEIDDIARYGATTVYFNEYRIDMLPPYLSSGECSLIENKERCALSCIFKFTKEFDLISYEFFNTLIINKRNFSYEEAENIYKSGEGEISYKVGLLMKISERLKLNRTLNGALELNANNSTSSLIEEFMLLTNMKSAEFMLTHYPEYSLLRKHPKVDEVNIINIINGNNDILIDKSKEDKRNILNDFIKNSNIPVVKDLVIKSMNQAYYFCSSTEVDYRHYGIAADIFTHFTSPIRRYVDLLVHRIIKSILRGMRFTDIKYLDKENINWMNWRNRNAKNASRIINELYLLKDGSVNKNIYKGIVCTIEDSFCIVHIKELSLSGILLDKNNVKLYDEVNVVVTSNFEYYSVHRKILLKVVL
ncbi:RRP44 [Hepatospora eriocheir]|uniref:RRP44 n=1 Tax=Hepatospora eriocheir TaxID=1081669 RepID=A0A1X0Q900_9MICR|nr:RRP44 [Hepatospora eriocheir]